MSSKYITPGILNQNNANIKSYIEREIARMGQRGRFLSGWIASTGLPKTDPATTLPYQYNQGDYYIVESVNYTGDNYQPSGSQYTGAPSTVKETRELHTNDTYYYDGHQWVFISTGISVTWGAIGGNITDNDDLMGALGQKQDTISDLSTIRSGASAGATAVQPATLNNYATNSSVDTKIANAITTALNTAV